MSIERIIAKDGKFGILAPPMPGGIYMGGTDPSPFGDRDMDDGSDYLTVIGDVVSGEIVAFYSERSMDSDEVVEKDILLKEFYASIKFPLGAPSMMEMNRGEVAFREHGAKDKLHLLSRKATHIGHEFKDAKSRYGWNKDLGSGREALANDIMVKYLKLYASKLRFKRGILELQRFPNGNNDFVDALRGFCINWSNYIKKSEQTYARPQTKRRPYLTMENGFVIQKWADVPIITA